MSLLEIRNLHATVAGREILKGIDLTVNAGEVHAIMGPNGSGKSTLAQVLAGRELYAVTEGSVTYDGKDLLDLDPEERAQAGIFLAFQYPVEIPGVSNMYFLKAALNAVRKGSGQPELDALENVCMPALLQPRARDGVEERGVELLKAVGLGERLEHRPAELSGGEQQRVAVARALMNRPSLLLADEPTGNLDSKTGEAILDILWRLREESGTTLVMVTHDEHVATRGERVLEIADGRILE